MGVEGCDIAGSSAASQCFGSDFHQLSHDLRNPLNSIHGFAELLLMDKGLSPAHADYVRAILSGSEALTATVVSILDRAEAGERDTAAVESCKAPPAAAAASRRVLAKRARSGRKLRHPVRSRSS